MTTKTSLLHFLGTRTGREELERLLHCSQATESPSIYFVVVPTSPMRAEIWLKHLQTTFAIREFSLIVGTERLDQTPLSESGVDVIGKIPGGGTIRL